MFRFATTVKLYDTDATGALFFAAQFRLIHDACEAFLTAADFSVRGKPATLFPIVHAEADYVAPLRWGDAVAVEVRPGRVGKTSFGLCYRLIKNDGTVAGTVATVHVAVSGKTGRPMVLPAKLRAALTAASAPQKTAG
jgi:YbgC/YbaW family acyl-CoA thioester hydrolase